MRKNKMMRIASVLLVAVLLSTCAISGTFAKYTSSYTSASDSARVAKWAFSGAAASQTFTFDLFNTANIKNENGNDETNVKEGDDVVIIAPGTTGSFDIVIKNDSEVNATCSISLTKNLNGIPLQFFIIVAGDTVAEGDDIEFDMGATVTATVQWVWPFDAEAPNTDTADTALGTANSLATATVSATVIVEQVD